MYDEDDDIPECPLCLDPLELDDVNFYPCTCGYQICRFCWHRIRTDENGLCPQCRKPYSEDPVRFKPLSNEEVLKMKKDRDRRAKEKKGNAIDGRKHLANLRVVQPNLLFVVGLTQRMADADTLKRPEHFGRFGKINKLSVTVTSNSSSAVTVNPSSNRFSATCHVTYAKAEDALRALLFLDQSQLDSRTLRISIGTTKYCSNFVKGNTCHRKDCTYLHEVGPSDASFTKEAMQDGKHVEYERRLLLDFIDSNPHLAQQVDISKITSKALSTNSNPDAQQVQPLSSNENGCNSRVSLQNIKAAPLSANAKRSSNNTPQPSTTVVGRKQQQANATASASNIAAPSQQQQPQQPRGRSGSVSGKSRQSGIKNQAPSQNKSKDDASIVISQQQQVRPSRPKAVNGVPTSVSSVATSVSSRVVKAPASKPGTSKPPVRTSRLTTPDEPVWWSLDQETTEDSSPNYDDNAMKSKAEGASEPSSNPATLISTDAPSPLLIQNGVDSGFISSSSSTGGSEPPSIKTSITTTNETSIYQQTKSHHTNGTLVSLFSSQIDQSMFQQVQQQQQQQPKVDSAIAAIVPNSSSFNTAVEKPPQQHQHPVMQPGRPIDIKDLIRLGNSPNMMSMKPSDDDLDVDPMEESIRRLNDLMAAEQKKKQQNNNGYSMFSTEQQQPASAKLQHYPPGLSIHSNGSSFNSRPTHSANYPSVAPSSLFSSFGQQQQQQPQPPQNGYNSNAASWPSFSTGGYSSTNSVSSSYAPQQRSYGNAFQNNSDDTSASQLANWLMPSLQQQQQQQQSASFFQQPQQNNSNRQRPNEYLSSVFAAVGKVCLPNFVVEA